MTNKTDIIPLWAIVHHSARPQVYLAHSPKRAALLVTGAIGEHHQEPVDLENVQEITDCIAQNEFVPMTAGGVFVSVTSCPIDWPNPIWAALADSLAALRDGASEEQRQELVERIESLFQDQGAC